MLETHRESETLISSRGGFMPSLSTNKRKLIAGLILLCVMLFILVDSFTNQHVEKATKSFLEWSQNGMKSNPALGIFSFICIYFVATVCLLPDAVLTLGGGFIFAHAFGFPLGVLLGFITTFIGSTSGGLVAFLLGRFILRDWAQNLISHYPYFKAIDSALQKNCLRIMVLLRLTPVIPFGILNYASGITSIPFLEYATAMLAVIPAAIMFTAVGASANSVTESTSAGNNDTIKIVFIVMGVIFGTLSVMTISHYAKKELNAAVRDEREEGGIQTVKDIGIMT